MSPVTRSDRDGALIWIEGALELLARSGPHAIRIEPLSRKIGVSKGSFYWFFSGREDLVAAVLKHWNSTYNAAIFREVEASEGGLAQKLEHLISRVMGSDLGRYDAAIRAWALHDHAVRAFVGQVDRDRLAFLERLFGDETPMRAHIFYRAFVAESYVSEYPKHQHRAEFLRGVAAFLTTRPQGD